ncbi:SH3 domain-containing protein [Rhodoligotrophos defluvii]|uniref:SH3 domain-containing protein n=1 Tax=Rhodoligotrophos defluvii TaxID=2561934 RepID=UPI001484E0BD|nr:SH3 domain-containing protein [Rhodoligotrophos defluvii]
MKQRSRRAASLAVILMGAVALALAVAGTAGLNQLANATGEEAKSDAAPSGSRTLGPSGLPLPRFVSLKSDEVNVRRGPSSEHQIVWVYSRRNLPVEIIAEFENWRRVRDSDGEEGWVYHSLLSSRRTVLVSPWKEGASTMMMQQSDESSRPVAKVESGVLGFVQQCTGRWCRVQIGSYSGWLPQNMLWGVYPGEKIE